jgi:catechol 2,3-dioxygenase-like lactoylglutathione lyase family enzyme
MARRQRGTPRHDESPDRTRRGISLDAVKFHVENARAKLELQRRRELRHWQGAPVTTPRPAEGEMMTSELKLGPIGQVSRMVSDVPAAVAWYRDVLQLPLLWDFGSLAFFDCNGTRLYLGQPEGDAPAGDSVLYFQVPEINAAYETLKQRGIEFLGAPHMIHKHADGTEEWMAFFKDCEGGMLAIMSQLKPD